AIRASMAMHSPAFRDYRVRPRGQLAIAAGTRSDTSWSRASGVEPALPTTCRWLSLSGDGFAAARTCVILSHGQGLEDQHREARQRRQWRDAPGTVSCR